jgi:hypothetical protein
MLASIPARALNQNPSDLGIPNRFSNNESGSKEYVRSAGPNPLHHNFGWAKIFCGAEDRYDRERAALALKRLAPLPPQQ